MKNNGTNETNRTNEKKINDNVNTENEKPQIMKK